MLGFKSFETAMKTIEGVERMGREVLAVWDTPIDIVEDQPSYFGDLTLWVDEIQGAVKADLDRNVRMDRFLLPKGTFDNSGLVLLID